MRRLCGLRSTRVWIDDVGGETQGAGGWISPLAAVRVLLAGIAAELDFALVKIDWLNCRSDDVDRAREILEQSPNLRLLRDASGLEVVTTEDALSRHYEAVCELLAPCDEVIDRLACRLEREGGLSARSVAGMVRSLAIHA